MDEVSRSAPFLGDFNIGSNSKVVVKATVFPVKFSVLGKQIRSGQDQLNKLKKLVFS